MAAFSVDDLLTSYPPPVVSTVKKLRQLIHQIAPEVKEKANRGWRSISYRDSQVGYFCGIFPFEDHVDLIFEFGWLLDDPHGILQGDTRQTRYLRFHEAGDIDGESVKFFLQEALGLLPASHSVRLGLTQNKLTLGPGEN
jgi:hypothetical protein